MIGERMMSDDGTKLSRRELLTLTGAAGAAALIAPAVAPGFGAGVAEAAEGGLPQVPRRRLGKTNKEVPILLLGGAVKLDPRFDPKLAEALRFGVNYVDAADCYNGGTCETAVGNFHVRAKVREKLWITSKSDDHDPEGFEQTVNRSLEKLQTSWVDLYFLHALRDSDYLSPKLEKVVARLKKAGKIRHFGFSCHHGNVAELLEVAAKTPWVEAVMFRYNFRQYGDAKLNRAIDACVKADVGLIAMKTQASEASFADAWKKFKKTGKWNKYQAVMKAVWADKRIAAAVSAMDTFEKLKENIAAAVDKSELTSIEQRALWEYADATRSLACDGCDHLCNPAVDAPVRIGDTMRFLMYHDVYHEPDKARALFEKLPAEARRLSGVDFSGANRACPHGVDVAAHMKRAAMVLS